jgi:predicted PurR-regulated permease PerM
MSTKTYLQKYLIENRLVAALGLFLLLWVLWQLKTLLFALLISLILTASLRPLVDRLEKGNIPRSIASLIPVLLLLLLSLALILPTAPVLVNQGKELYDNLDTIILRVNTWFPVEIVPEDWAQTAAGQITNISNRLFQVTGSIIEIFFMVFLTLFISYYFLLDYQKLRQNLTAFLNGFNPKKSTRLFAEVETTLGQWARGQFILSVFVGGLAFLVYLIIGLPFALTLALFAAVLELVPNLGPVLAAIPAVLIALTVSPLTAAYTLIGFVLIQAVESYLLVPKVMEKTVGLHPVVVVLTIVAGSALLGIMGALLAVPLTASTKVIWQNLNSST